MYLTNQIWIASGCSVVWQLEWPFIHHISAKLGSNWPSSFRENIFLVFDKSDIGTASASMLLYCSEQHEIHYWSFITIDKVVSDENIKMWMLMTENSMTFGSGELNKIIKNWSDCISTTTTWPLGSGELNKIIKYWWDHINTTTNRFTTLFNSIFYPNDQCYIPCYNIEFHCTNAVKYLQHAFPLNHAKSFFLYWILGNLSSIVIINKLV